MNIDLIVVTAGFVVTSVASVAALTVSFRSALRTATHAAVAKTPGEFVMMEKAAKPFKVKAHKTPAPQVYGL